MKTRDDFDQKCVILDGKIAEADERLASIESQIKDVLPYRPDLKTRLSIMAAIIYGTGDPDRMTATKAIDVAVEIENQADSKVRELKRTNYIKPIRDQLKAR